VQIVHPTVHGVHGTAALGPDGHVVFAGLGGTIDDDPDAAREEIAALRYPRWEAEYRLRILDELGGQPPVLLFATPPGSLADGRFAVADLHAREAETRVLAEVA
jgi:hypothetical protein